MKHHDVLIVDEGEGYAAMLSNQQLELRGFSYITCNDSHSRRHYKKAIFFVDCFGFADTGIYGSQVLFQIKTIVPENLSIKGGVNGL